MHLDRENIHSRGQHLHEEMGAEIIDLAVEALSQLLCLMRVGTLLPRVSGTHKKIRNRA